MAWVSVMLGGICCVFLLLSGWMALQVVCARPGHIRRDARDAPGNDARPSVAVLVPAHNEATGIAATLHTLRSQLTSADRLLVVADNCSDDTARIARASGAEVLEREHESLRGKGHALAAGFACLNAPDSVPRDVLIVIDADCQIGPDALVTLARQAHASGRPAQALYLMTNVVGVPTSRRQRFSEFAWRIKNGLRPLGLHRLGLPCQLMGSGMAFPWALMARHSFASGHLVEDMQLGLALAQAGHAPHFCPQAVVTSVFPTDAQAQARQRTRWEHGHLSMITQTLPGLLGHWLQRPRADLLAMALDVAIPPLSLLAMACVLCGVGSAIWAVVSGAVVPLLLAVGACAAFAVAVFTAWRRAGVDLLSSRDLTQMASYVAWKLPLYARFITARQLSWVRSQRHEEGH